MRRRRRRTTACRGDTRHHHHHYQTRHSHRTLHAPLVSGGGYNDAMLIACLIGSAHYVISAVRCNKMPTAYDECQGQPLRPWRCGSSEVAERTMPDGGGTDLHTRVFRMWVGACVLAPSAGISQKFCACCVCLWSKSFATTGCAHSHSRVCFIAASR